MDNDWAALARKQELTDSDVFRLVSYGGEPLREGFDDEYLAVSRNGIRLSPCLITPDAIRLLPSEEQAFLLDLERFVRLDFPCTPLELLDWFERNNETTPAMDEQGGVTSALVDVVKLQPEFIKALRPQPAKNKGGRPRKITQDFVTLIEDTIRRLDQTTIHMGAVWIAQSKHFTETVFKEHKQCTAAEYSRTYGIGLRTVTDQVRKAIKKRSSMQETSRP
jgi:hypothetical protein